MGLYWRRSTKIIPGVRINWSKRGPSISVGPKGAKMNFGKRGTYVSGSIPGTGLYYRKKVGGNSKSKASSTERTNSSASIPQTTVGFSKQGCLLFIAASVILSLLLSSNFITAALVTILIGVCWFFMSRKGVKNTQSSTNASLSPQSQSASASNASVSSQSASSPNNIDIKVAISEAEHLITEIDNTTDKIKLPSIYRKLMSIIYKLEKINGIEIQNLPIEEAKKRILENYRKRLNS